MRKLLVVMASGLLSLGLTGLLPTWSSEAQDDGPPKKKGDAKKDERGPAGDLRKAYDLLRRIKSDDGPSGRSDERLRDWTERAAKLYRRGVQSDEPRLSHEYGAAAHDLARAVDHARNAARLDRLDSDLPAPPEGPGPEGDGERARHDLRRAYDRIREADDDGPDAKFYLDAAHDLYNAARRDALKDRTERAGELARAAEALTHVTEHLGHIAEPEKPEPRGKAEKKDREEKAEPKVKKAEKKEREEKAEPKVKKAEKKDREEEDDLPPALPPRD